MSTYQIKPSYQLSAFYVHFKHHNKQCSGRRSAMPLRRCRARMLTTRLWEIEPLLPVARCVGLSLSAAHAGLQSHSADSRTPVVSARNHSHVSHRYCNAMPTRWTTTQSGNLVSPSHDNCGLYWTVSVPVNDTVGPVEKLGTLQTLICAPVVRPKRCPTLSNPVLLTSCLRFTLLMMLLLRGWPTIGLNHICKKNCIKDNYQQLLS